MLHIGHNASNLGSMEGQIERAPSIEDVRSRAPVMNESELDYGLLGDLAGFSIKLAWIIGYSLLQKTIKDSAITPLRLSMLELVGRNPGKQQNQLGAALGLSRSAATLAIDFWDERGCVERRVSPDDRRSFGIYLTAAGEQEVERLRRLVRQSDEALTSNLTAPEVAQLRALLAKIHG